MDMPDQGLRIDAQRNLDRVSFAAREVFGEFGYEATIEDVARRAHVGVGTIYRRFPSKDLLVRWICQEEIHRLTDLARILIKYEDSWAALSQFVRHSVDSGAGKLLPVQLMLGNLERDSNRNDDNAAELEFVSVVDDLVERAYIAGYLREDVVVNDIFLIIITAGFQVANIAPGMNMSERLVDILLEGLRVHPSESM